MRRGKKTAICLAAAIAAAGSGQTAAGPFEGMAGPAIALAEEKGMMTADLSGVVQGQILEDLWTNRSMYNPGESIQATAKLSGNASGAYRAEIYLNHLGETV